MKEAHEFTVSDLKTRLQQRSLPTTGTKNELIGRLQAADPSGAWRSEQESVGEPVASLGLPNGLEKVSEQNRTQSTDVTLAEAQRVVNLSQKEKDLMQRELDLVRREMELLRATANQNIAQSAVGGRGEHVVPDIKAISALLSDFSGNEDSFEHWRKQLTLLRTTYKLDDQITRVLIGAKLVGSAYKWFHSRPEYLELTIDGLLEEMKKMFQHKVDRLTLRRQFEAKRWRPNETFSEYFHEKLILANKIQVAEEELIEYILEGITDTQLQNQARLHKFQSISAILEAFEKISLPRNVMNRNKWEQLRPVKENFMQPKQGKRCFNCHKEGHIKAECTLQLKERRACFNCGSRDHMERNCPKRMKESTPVNQIYNVNEEEVAEDDVFKNVVYAMSDNNRICKMRLNTLLDSGSPVSFIKFLEHFQFG